MGEDVVSRWSIEYPSILDFLGGQGGRLHKAIREVKGHPRGRNNPSCPWSPDSQQSSSSIGPWTTGWRASGVTSLEAMQDRKSFSEEYGGEHTGTGEGPFCRSGAGG